MKKLFLTAAVFLAISACATPEQIAQRRAWQEQEDINQCAGYVLNQGTEAFAQCRMYLDLARTYPRHDYYYYTPNFGYYPYYRY